MGLRWTTQDIVNLKLASNISKKDEIKIRPVKGRSVNTQEKNTSKQEIMSPVARKRANKYNARKVIHDGFVFDSTKEGNRYIELKLMQRVGEITSLELQPEYDLCVNGVSVCKYRGDFSYITKGSNRVIVEDVKSEHTRTLPVYRIKKKMMKACYGIDIREV